MLELLQQTLNTQKYIEKLLQTQTKLLASIPKSITEMKHAFEEYKKATKKESQLVHNALSEGFSNLNSSLNSSLPTKMQDMFRHSTQLMRDTVNSSIELMSPRARMGEVGPLRSTSPFSMSPPTPVSVFSVLPSPF
jgi:hypothetical protein